MANNKKKTPSNVKYVTLGSAAHSFYDASTGIFISKGEKKMLTARQLNSPKIKKALHSGHLQYIAEDNKVKRYSEEDIEKLVTKFTGMVEKGMEATKIASAFSDEEVDKIAAKYNLTRDTDEQSVSVIQTIISELEDKPAEE